MASSAFAKWYLAMLKSHPFAANMSTAIFLMTAGDAMAQGMEHNSLAPVEQQEEQDNFLAPAERLTVEGTKPSAVSAALDKWASSSSVGRSFALRRHATLSPLLEVAHCDHGITRLEWESHDTEEGLEATTPKSCQGLPLDIARTSSMAFWAGAVQAPFFLVLYRFYDRILPTAITPYAVGSRVALSFISTIPFTAAFFGYGAFVHHLLHKDDGNIDDTCEELSLQEGDSFWTTVANQIQEKWSNDLGATLQTSASVWVPFNTVNFSLIPPHLRPLSMMTMSACWNCYLSLVQHKE